MPTFDRSAGLTCDEGCMLLSRKADGGCAAANVHAATSICRYPYLREFEPQAHQCFISSGGGFGRTGRPRSSISFIACEIGMCIVPLASLNGCGGFSNSCSDARKLRHISALIHLQSRLRKHSQVDRRSVLQYRARTRLRWRPVA